MRVSIKPVGNTIDLYLYFDFNLAAPHSVPLGMGYLYRLTAPKRMVYSGIALLFLQDVRIVL